MIATPHDAAAAGADAQAARPPTGAGPGPGPGAATIGGVPADPWQALAQAGHAGAWLGAWLQVLASALTQARAGLLLLRQPDDSFAPVATWPAGRDLAYLAEIATESLRTREGVVRRDELRHVRLAYPLTQDGRLHGAVVLDLGPAAEPAVAQASRLTHWGAGWLLEMLGRHEARDQAARTADGAFLLDTALALMAEPGLREAGLALVNRLGRRLSARQVLLALPRGKALRLLATSHAASFDERAQALGQAVQAMHEAFDQRRMVQWPAPDDADPLLLREAHRRHAEAVGAPALLSLPLADANEVVGVLLLELESPPDAAALRLLDAAAGVLAPVLRLQREAGESLPARSLRRGRFWLGRIVDGSHPALKLGVGVAAIVLLLLAVVPAPFRISAPALVEGAVQRAAVAPFEGYVREAPARAGDVVRRGQVLAVLEDKDLRLEKLRWESDLEVALGKEREAMAAGNRVNQRLASAQANQARAQLDLVLAKLERVNIAAPFDGVVVKGDLSQQLGSPVEQGKVLFELAPLDAWRVILKVDERDIGEVRLGQGGRLVLASLPGQAWDFTVSKITPVSVAEEGHNFFRVEAQLAQGAPKLSPNMEGVAKVDAGRASLLWTWTRPLVHWARIAWWKWTP